MSEHERRHNRSRRASEPLHPSPLPPDMAEFLRTQERTALFWGTDIGTILVVKLPRSDIRGIPSPVPIHVAHELYEHPAAPVSRSVVTIMDQPGNPLRLESFTNVGDPDQEAHFATLATQDRFYAFFYDERVRHRRTVAVGVSDPEGISGVLRGAQERYKAMPPGRHDFDRAKAEVM